MRYTRPSSHNQRVIMAAVSGDRPASGTRGTRFPYQTPRARVGDDVSHVSRMELYESVASKFNSAAVSATASLSGAFGGRVSTVGSSFSGRGLFWRGELMGEAKRRRSLLGRELPGVRVDPRTGAAVEVPSRFGGSITSAMARQGEVPCGGCIACCYHPCVDVHPENDRPEDLARLDLVTREDGTIMVRKRSDGACVHLGERGCTVYAHRPHGCRLYDCRMYAMVGVLDSYDGGRTSPVWRFDAS